MSSSNISRKERRKKQTRLTFDPISAGVPLASPAKSQGPSPAKVRYGKVNGSASVASGGRVTRSGMSSGSPSKVISGINGKSGGKRKGKDTRNGKISFGSLPTPAKSSQKDDTIVNTGVVSGSRRSTRGSQVKKPIAEDATDLADESTVEVEATTPLQKDKKEIAAIETTDDESDVDTRASTRRGSGSGSSRRRSLTGRGFIQGGSTYNAPLPSFGSRGRAPKALVHSPSTPPKSTPKRRSVTLSDTSDDDIFTSMPKPSQRPGLFSQKLAAPMQSSDESCEEADNDSEEDILPSSTRRRQTARIIPQVLLELDSDDPDDEPPTSPMKRKRPTIISDDEDSDVESPVKKTKVMNECESDDDLPPMTKLAKTTVPESDSPVPSPQVKRKLPAKKHRTAKQKQLEILKRKRAGESNPILTDSESDEEEVGGLYDSGSDALTTFEDEEDEEVEEEIQETRIRKSPKKPVQENEDKYDSDFVDDDDDGLIGVPDYAMIPLHLTAAAHKPLKEHFVEAVEWCVQNKINPGFSQNLMPIYKSAWNKLEDAYSGLSGSKFVSTSWTRDFTKALYARPEFHTRRLLSGEAVDLLGEVKCEACNRRKHVPTWGISLKGSAYYKDSLAEVEKDDSDTEEDEEEEDSDGEKDTRSLNSRDEPLPCQDKEFMVGSVCKENAENAHTLIHLKFALNQWVIGSLESQGHLTIEKLAKRDQMSAKKRQKEVNGIVDKWKEENEIKELYSIWKQQLETAQNASTTGRR
ncbi:2e54fb7a-e112-4696-846f-5ba72e1de7b6 [Sclerotinia trifoliorum]|uniref:2e54fb7a-e112-4696-846f-5ba72e1de7b6 n=1 Tax=Sclerotinia trifoliorum TaxID=28548 RepID=A0A8H2VLH6_9HELO|nr:2e54fb7a-e112-4696-846f-5ba72e1de7b6 [Sclerotinia trifoliorum]